MCGSQNFFFFVTTISCIKLNWNDVHNKLRWWMPSNCCTWESEKEFWIKSSSKMYVGAQSTINVVTKCLSTYTRDWLVDVARQTVCYSKICWWSMGSSFVLGSWPSAAKDHRALPAITSHGLQGVPIKTTP